MAEDLLSVEVQALQTHFADRGGELHWRPRCSSTARRKERHTMATVVSPPEQRIVLDNITWDVYEQLLATHRDRGVPRFTYDRGRLEIINPSAEHEELKHMVALFVEVIAEEMIIDVRGLGSTTLAPTQGRRSLSPCNAGTMYAQRP